LNATHVNVKALEKFMEFTRLFWDCLNKIGWRITKAHKQVSEADEKQEFVTNCEAEYVPEACNEFCKEFIKKEPNIERSTAINMTLYFCDWIYRVAIKYFRVPKI